MCNIMNGRAADQSDMLHGSSVYAKGKKVRNVRTGGVMGR